MKKPLLLLFGVALSIMSYGQARLVFNNVSGESYMVFDPAGTSTTYVVIENATPAGITELPSAGTAANIKSEHQNNRIRWENTAQVGTYIVPFTTATGVKIPLTVTKTTAGTAPVGSDSASFVLATYNHSVVPGAEWNNSLYRPNGVTHMNDFFVGAQDNSENAVNRFWILDPRTTAWGFTAPPGATLQFITDNADVDMTGVTPGVDKDLLTVGAISTPLQAQRFNTTTSKWGDYLSEPVSVHTPNSPVGRGTVSNVVVSSANFFGAWTMSSQITPLPIELTRWEGACDGKEVKLTWSTGSETNNDFFTIEKSLDAETWEVIGEVDAVGNSTSTTNYSFVDDRTEGLAYYRLGQTDNNGTSRVFDVVAAGCEANSTEIVSAWSDGNNLNVLVSSTDGGIYDVYLTDAAGKTMVLQGSQTINKNFTQLAFSTSGVSRGMYTVTLQNTDHVMSRRVVLM